MTIKGYPDSTKRDDGAPAYATVQPIRDKQFGADVVATQYAYEVTADAAENGSTALSVVATSHVARRGDIILWTSGALAGREYRVKATTTDGIDLVEEMAAAPSAGNAFSILRHRTPIVGSDGLPFAAAAAGRSYVDSAYHDHTTPVTTSAWTQLIASTAGEINGITLFDGSGSVLELGVGAALSEARVLLIPPGGIEGFVPLRIAAGSRLAVKAVSANTSAGALVLTGLS